MFKPTAACTRTIAAVKSLRDALMSLFPHHAPARLSTLPGLGLSALFLTAFACSGRPTSEARFAEAPSSRATAAPGAVLMVLSAAPVQTLVSGTTRETGYFLNEFYEPYRALEEAGYTIAIATPGGRPPALDPESLKLRYWRDPEELAEARAVVDRLPQMAAPLELASLPSRAGEFQAIVVPGGQGVMIDLLNDPDLHILLTEFGESGRPVGLVCHAPAILTRLPGSNVFHDRRVTAVSGLEEWFIETFVMGARARVRSIASALDTAGYRYDSALPSRPHAVRDCNLITSQNPFSGEPFRRHLLDALIDWRNGARCVPADGKPG